MKNIFVFPFLCVLLFASCKPDPAKIKLNELAAVVENDLYKNIIPFWLNHSMDEVNGGFYGTVDSAGVGNPESTKGVILNSRILWTFSTLHFKDKDNESLQMATRAYEYITKYFIDPEYGGVYYMLDKTGKAVNDEKNIYATAFAIYGLSEYYRATGKPEALEHAKAVFETMDKYAHDALHGGYSESYTRDWQVPQNNDLAKQGKSMNTSLHVMEALANLYRVWKSPLLEKRLTEMITIFLDKIINPDTHLQFYLFDQDWSNRSHVESYGHDIECSWLLIESAEILGDEALVARAKDVCLAMAQASVKALQPDGLLIYESDSGKFVKWGSWWSQAEAIVGYVNAWQLSGEEVWMDRALLAWKYTDDHFVDKKYGEWHGNMRRNGSGIDTGGTKIHAWKAPYHNSRMCVEIIHRAHLYGK